MRGYGRKLIIAGGIAVLLLSCPPEPEPDSAIAMDVAAAARQGGPAIAVPEDFAGFCHAGYSNNLDLEYDEILKELEVVWVHRDFSWGTIQPSEGAWDFTQFDSYVQRANDEGKKVMGMLLYDVKWVHTLMENLNQRRIYANEILYFTEYAVETVKRYNGKNGYGKVDAWLIWNEPDLNPRFWEGTQDEFFALTRATAEAIRALDETEATHTTLIGGVYTSTVISAIYKDWVTGLLEYENVKDLLDGVAFHPYGPDPEASEGVFNLFKEIVKPYGFEDKVWLNEMGYPTYPEKGAMNPARYGTDQWEGDMPVVVAQTFALLAASEARNLTWYHLFDSENRNNADSEAWFGLVWRKSNDEWIKKGGYWGYALCANNIPGKDSKQLQFPGLPADIRHCYFEGGGKRVLLAWNTDPLSRPKVRVTLGGSNHKLWNLETGESVTAAKTSVHTLNPAGPSQKQTLLFFTWDE